MKTLNVNEVLGMLATIIPDSNFVIDAQGELFIKTPFVVNEDKIFLPEDEKITLCAITVAMENM